jgi:putative redox protein
MKAVVKRIQGMTLAAKADSNHWLTMDAAESIGGMDAGSRPVELILMGLGGCTSMDVLSILQKKRITLDDYEVHVEAERAEDHPKVFTHIKIKFIFYGKDISEEAVKRAIELSETKYCSVSAMLSKSVPITVEYEIKERGVEP